MMPGVQVQEVVEALTGALNDRELADMLPSRPEIRRDELAVGRMFFQVVSDLLAWAVWQNQEAPLVRTAYQANPHCPNIREIYQKYGITPQASVQKAGVPVPKAVGGRLAFGLRGTAADLPASAAELRVLDHRPSLGLILHQPVGRLALGSRERTAPSHLTVPGGIVPLMAEGVHHLVRPPLALRRLFAEDAPPGLLDIVAEMVEVQADRIDHPVQFDLVADPGRPVNVGDLLIGLGEVGSAAPSVASSAR